MLTTEQRASLLAAINADQTTLAMASEGNYGGIADYFNDLASPAFTVWKTEASNEEILRNGMDWTRVDNLTVGASRIWEWMMQFGTFNPAKPNIRAGIDAVWKGTAADLAVRAAVYRHCQRDATRIEKLFATGTGTPMPNGSPATMSFEGEIGWPEVKDIIQNGG